MFLNILQHYGIYLKNNDPNESLKMFTEDIKLNTQSLIVENDINDLYNGNVNIYQEDVENKESKKEEETPDNIEIIMPPEEKTKEENITNNIDKRGLS